MLGRDDKRNIRIEKNNNERLLVEPILPLATAATGSSINGPTRIRTALRTVDQVTSKAPVFELEELRRIFVQNRAVALHVVAVKHLSRCVSTVAVERERHWVRESTWPLGGIVSLRRSL